MYVWRKFYAADDLTIAVICIEKNIYIRENTEKKLGWSKSFANIRARAEIIPTAVNLNSWNKRQKEGKVKYAKWIFREI